MPKLLKRDITETVMNYKPNFMIGNKKDIFWVTDKVYNGQEISIPYSMRERVIDTVFKKDLIIQPNYDEIFAGELLFDLISSEKIQISSIEDGNYYTTPVFYLFDPENGYISRYFTCEDIVEKTFYKPRLGRTLDMLFTTSPNDRKRYKELCDLADKFVNKRDRILKGNQIREDSHNPKPRKVDIDLWTPER